MIKKIILILMATVLISTSLTGCKEDTLSLERNLYYDMEAINRAGLDFMTEMIKKVSGLPYRQDILDGSIKMMEDKTGGLKPPKHLKQEVKDWKQQVYITIDIFKQLKDGGTQTLGPEQLEAFDYGRQRIYDGFKEFKISRP